MLLGYYGSTMEKIYPGPPIEKYLDTLVVKQNIMTWCTCTIVDVEPGATSSLVMWITLSNGRKCLISSTYKNVIDECNILINTCYYVNTHISCNVEQFNFLGYTTIPLTGNTFLFVVSDGVDGITMTGSVSPIKPKLQNIYKLVEEIKLSSREQLQYFVAQVNQSFCSRIPLVEQIKLLKYIIDREIAGKQFHTDHPTIQQSLISPDEYEYYQLHINDVGAKLACVYSETMNEQIMEAVVVIMDAVGVITPDDSCTLTSQIGEIVTKWMSLQLV
jgi:hypothetical protein